MAVNPMQRKANNSFLLGILITLLITGVIIALLLMQLSKLNTQIKEEEASTVYGYVLTSEVKSGTEIQPSQVKSVELNTTIQSETIYSSKIMVNGKETIDTNGTSFPIGKKAKVDLHPGMVLTSDVTYEDELVTADVRKMEYNIVTLPSQIQTGEYIDIRLSLPGGQDYIVVSHKQVEIPQVNGIDSESCMWVELSEDEILMMSNAIVESYRMNGSKLYATRYVEAGMQDAASVTYLPSDAVIALMQKDKNIVQTAKNAIFERTRTDEKGVVRNPINGAINHEDAEDNLTEGVTKEIQGLKEERQKYLESFGAE